MLLRNYIKYFKLPALQQAVSYKHLHNQVERCGLRKRTCDTVAQSAVLVAVCRFAAKRERTTTTQPLSSCVSWTGNPSFVQTGTINALHVFQNSGYVAVGNGFIDYRFQPIIGTGVSLTTSVPGVNLRTVYFHDNRVGIAAGDNFQWVDIEAVTDPLSKVWTSFVKNNVSSVFITAETALTGNTAPTARITALAFGDRSRCVWGGVSTASYVR